MLFKKRKNVKPDIFETEKDILEIPINLNCSGARAKLQDVFMNILVLVQVFKILKNVDNVNKETWFKQLPEERSHRTRATEGGHNIVRVNSKLEVRRKGGENQWPGGLMFEISS